MRLLMLNNEFPPLGGGTGSVNKAMLDRFTDVDWLNIDLITSALGTCREELQYADRVRITKVPVNNRDIHHSSARELLTYAWRALIEARRRHNAESYDFCFAWSSVPAGWVAMQLRRSLRLPYLVRVCGVDIPGFEQRYRLLYPVLKPVVRRVWRQADSVVAKCRGEVDLMRAVDSSVEPMIVQNGVDLAAFKQAAPRAEGEPLRLICVGRLIERKGQRHLIESVSRLVSEGCDAHLELVGTGDAEQQYRSRVRELGLDGRVLFSGYVPRERVPDHYASAHVFVLPSFNEGMSVSTLEAMAAGLPLVVTRTGGVDELVEEGVNGLTFEYGDIDALTAHLRTLFGDARRMTLMGAASRERAAGFSWDLAAKRYVEMLAAIVPA